MDFRIAISFTDSFARLTGEEQKAVKTTAFDLQLDPTNHGMKFHRLDQAKDKNFWSVRVNSDLRLIVHKTASSLLLCYVSLTAASAGTSTKQTLKMYSKSGAPCVSVSAAGKGDSWVATSAAVRLFFVACRPRKKRPANLKTGF